MSFWFYLFIGSLLGALVGAFVRVFTKRPIIVNVIALSFVLFGFVLTKYVVMPHYLAYTFADSIRKESPLVNLIAIRAPDDFQQYVNHVKDNLIANENPANIYLFTNTLISKELMKTIPHASDASIYKYLTVCLQIDKQLIKQNPSYVLFIEYPYKFINKIDSAEVYKNIEPQTLQRLLEAKEEIIISAYSNQTPSLDIAHKLRANFMFADIISNLSQEHGRKSIADTFQFPDAPSTNKQQAAEIIIQYYESILAKGPDKAGMIYKALFLGN